MPPIGVADQIISSYGPGDPTQRRALHYYHTTALNDLSGVIAVGFWDRVVPERCQSERVVRHAVVALSHAHLDFVMQVKRPSGQQKTPTPSRQSLEAYAKASKALRRYIESDKSLSREAVLTCCLIFGTIEKIHGRPAIASVHVENGLAILNSWQQDLLARGQRLYEFEHMNEVLIMFGRHDVCATIADASRKPRIVVSRDEGVPSGSKRETRDIKHVSLGDARRNYLRRMPCALETWRLLVAALPYRHSEVSCIPDGILEARRRLRAEHCETEEELTELIMQHTLKDVAQDSDPESPRFGISTVLRASQLHSIVNARVLDEILPRVDEASPPRPDLWDSEPEQFLQIASDVLERRRLWRKKQALKVDLNLSPEVAITGGLLLLAHRTALPHIRMQAFAMAERSAEQGEGLREDVVALKAALSCSVGERPMLLFKYPGH